MIDTIKARIANLKAAEDTQNSLSNWIGQLFSIVLEEVKDRDMVNSQFELSISEFDNQNTGSAL